MLKYVSITLEAYNILLAIILFTSIVLRYYQNDRVQSWFKYVVLNNAIMSAANIVRFVFEGNTTPAGHIIMHITIPVLYTSAFCLIITTGIQFMVFLHQEKWRAIVYHTLIFNSIIFTIFLVLTPFIGFLYKIDENNVYHRGNFYQILIVLQFLFYIAVILYVWRNRKTVPRLKIVVIAIFLLYPHIGEVIQYFFEDLSLISSGYTIAFLLMFILANRRLEKKVDDTGIY